MGERKIRDYRCGTFFVQMSSARALAGPHVDVVLAG